MTQDHIFTLLTQDYTLLPATTEKELEAVKVLRREVFSKKFNLSVDTLEKEGYIFNEEDAQSFIYLIKHNESQSYVGTVRIFFINEQTPLKELSMQRIGKVTGIDNYTKNLPLAEISRMCLKHNLPSHTTHSTLQVRNILAYALMVMTRINFFLYRPAMVFAVMETSLFRLLSRQNVFFQQIAEPVEFYGIRIPYTIERNKLLQDTESTMGKVTRHYLKALCTNPSDFWSFIDNNPYLARTDTELERLCELFHTHGDDVTLDMLLGDVSIHA